MKPFFYIVSVFCCLICEVFADVVSTNISNGNLFLSFQWNNERRYGRTGKTNDLTIPAGKQLIIHGINMFPKGTGVTGSSAFVRKYNASSKLDTIVGMAPSASLAISWNGPILGPANLIYGLDTVLDSGLVYSALPDDSDYLKTSCEFLFEIKDDPFQATLAPSASISSTSIVVPSNAVGDVDVLLEQSTDMITWTQCLPGTYNASTQKRFFRVRAVEK